MLLVRVLTLAWIAVASCESTHTIGVSGFGWLVNGNLTSGLSLDQLPTQLQLVKDGKYVSVRATHSASHTSHQRSLPHPIIEVIRRLPLSRPVRIHSLPITFPPL